jgi:uncharacterized protein YpuA (DUF1002 family)
MGGGASKVVDSINPAKYIEQGRKEMEKYLVKEFKKQVIDPVVNGINNMGKDFTKVIDRLKKFGDTIEDTFDNVMK